jgi:hypothetical protein
MKELGKVFIFIISIIVVIILCNKLNVIAQQYPSLIQVTITCLEAKSKDSCNGKMDFYGRMQVNRKFVKFNNIVEGNRIFPQWYIRTKANKGYNWVYITILDEDDAFCGGGDDLVDVNPEMDIAELKLRIDTKTGKIYNYQLNNSPVYIGNVGRQITLHGFDHYTSGAWGSGGPVRGSRRNVETGVIHFIVNFIY